MVPFPSGEGEDMVRGAAPLFYAPSTVFGGGTSETHVPAVLTTVTIPFSPFGESRGVEPLWNGGTRGCPPLDIPPLGKIDGRKNL